MSSAPTRLPSAICTTLRNRQLRSRVTPAPAAWPSARQPTTAPPRPNSFAIRHYAFEVSSPSSRLRIRSLALAISSPARSPSDRVSIIPVPFTFRISFRETGRNSFSHRVPCAAGHTSTMFAPPRTCRRAISLALLPILPLFFRHLVLDNRERITVVRSPRAGRVVALSLNRFNPAIDRTRCVSAGPAAVVSYPPPSARSARICFSGCRIILPQRNSSRVRKFLSCAPQRPGVSRYFPLPPAGRIRYQDKIRL